MPTLNQVRYSEEATVAAITDFFAFLTKMLRISTEGPAIMEYVPNSVVGLINSEHDIFLLDTELGVVYWPLYPHQLRDKPRYIQDNPYDYYYNQDEAD
ncbi:uncharacterized protein B0I36DRAFT_384430 [Microdochium trichocladiopsis]|uniref:Uncharacterized protein n=1 Tax=Microdochium trichocladiopsis TaxID=1682393 RepID=A0A9P8Y483_9PEZI|nr:uncharacterized protein B0I36DRAFT_384430 [Microdochium trichocladiopsis]KAH7028755.1 hypothetical protein B0I36DRAFT_384430 [Microdochium trichocladiopsis]